MLSSSLEPNSILNPEDIIMEKESSEDKQQQIQG